MYYEREKKAKDIEEAREILKEHLKGYKPNEYVAYERFGTFFFTACEFGVGVIAFIDKECSEEERLENERKKKEERYIPPLQAVSHQRSGFRRKSYGRRSRGDREDLASTLYTYAVAGALGGAFSDSGCGYSSSDYDSSDYGDSSDSGGSSDYSGGD